MVTLLITDNLLRFDKILFMFFWRFADLQFRLHLTIFAVRRPIGTQKATDAGYLGCLVPVQYTQQHRDRRLVRINSS